MLQYSRPYVSSYHIFSTWSLALVVDADVLFSVGGFCERTPVQQYEDVGTQGCRLGPHVP